MIKALIIDDETKAREVLLHLIREEVPEITAVRAADGPGEGLDLIRRMQPDLVFLDIVMPQMNGFDLLKELGEWNFDVIFTTAYDRFAIQAIRFSALDYLLKPIDEEELRRSVDRHLRKRRERSGQPPQEQYRNLVHNLETGRTQEFRLAIPTAEGVFFFQTGEIVRCEASSNYTLFHLTGNRRFLSSKTLKEYDDLLRPHGFVRVHKSHLLNLGYVEDYLGRGFVRLKDQTEIEVARRRREEVWEALQNKSA